MFCFINLFGLKILIKFMSSLQLTKLSFIIYERQHCTKHGRKKEINVIRYCQ